MKTNEKQILPITIEKLTKFDQVAITSNCIDIIFNLRGNQTISYQGNVYNMKEYDIIVINPFVPYTLYSTNTELVRIRINYFIIRSLGYEEMRIACNSCTYNNKGNFKNLYISLINYIKNYHDITLPKAYSLAYEFIDELYQNFNVQEKDNQGKSKLLEITHFIENNYQDNILLNDLAEQFHISVPYLSKLFKKELGINFANYYDKIRISNSMYELLNTNNSILDIAYKYGFSSNQAYIRAYKRLNNELPSETRKKNKIILKSPTDEIVPFKTILKELEKSEVTNSRYIDYYINSNFKAEPILIHNQSYKNILGVGSSRILLYGNIQSQIKEYQSIMKFKYANIRGLLSDEQQFCTKNVHGDIFFRFNLIDRIIDFLVENNLLPMISLTYMPEALASDKTKTIFSEEYNASAPKSLEEWKRLINALLEHFEERYGKDKSNQFVYIPWVSPESSYNQLGFKSDEEFYTFYETSFKTIKNFSSEIIVYSPEIFPDCQESFEWLDGFMKFCESQNCLPDVMALQYFSNDNWNQLKSQLLRGKFLHSIKDYGMKADPNDMHTYLTKVKCYLNSHNYNIPMALTSYNYTIKRNNKLLDTLFLADYVIKNYLDNFDILQGYSYWNFSDLENVTISQDSFNGGSGLYFRNGIPKPQKNAYRFFCFLNDEILDRGEGYILTRNSKRKNDYYLLIYNYEHPSYEDNSQEVNIHDDIYTAFKEKERKKFHLTINSLPFTKAFFRFFILNREYGSAYDKWLSMGRPDTNQFHQNDDIVFNSLINSANTDYKELQINITDNTLDVAFTLEPLEVKGIRIRFIE